MRAASPVHHRWHPSSHMEKHCVTVGVMVFPGLEWWPFITFPYDRPVTKIISTQCLHQPPQLYLSTRITMTLGEEQANKYLRMTLSLFWGCFCHFFLQTRMGQQILSETYKHFLFKIQVLNICERFLFHLTFSQVLEKPSSKFYLFFLPTSAFKKDVWAK